MTGTPGSASPRDGDREPRRGGGPDAWFLSRLDVRVLRPQSVPAGKGAERCRDPLAPSAGHDTDVPWPPPAHPSAGVGINIILLSRRQGAGRGRSPPAAVGAARGPRSRREPRSPGSARRRVTRAGTGPSSAGDGAHLGAGFAGAEPHSGAGAGAGGKLRHGGQGAGAVSHAQLWGESQISTWGATNEILQDAICWILRQAEGRAGRQPCSSLPSRGSRFNVSLLALAGPSRGTSRGQHGPAGVRARRRRFDLRE